MTKSSAARLEKRARRKPRRKRESLELGEVPNRVDVVFSPGSPVGANGWIEMSANAKGKEAIQRIFPKAMFQWRECLYPWKGWQSTIPHLPAVIAHCANTLPPDLLRQKPIQNVTDNQLSFLMASGAKDQGVRAAWITIDQYERPTLNFLEGKFERNPNVLNLPTVRPFDLSNPTDAFLYKMNAKAEENLARNDGTTEPIKKIIAGSDLVLAIWQDVSQPHGIGYLVIKGESLLKIGEPVEVTADAFAVSCYEMALAAKQTLV